MKGVLVLVIPLLVLLGLLMYADKIAPPEQKPYQLSPLAKVGVECEMITEKAAMELPEALPFQRLEKAGRQTHVLANCIKDRGYLENPDWVSFGQLQAAQLAKVSNISIDEAYEKLRRKYMMIYQAEKSEPIYWVLASTLAKNK
jgi:hypothetical protein